MMPTCVRWCTHFSQAALVFVRQSPAVIHISPVSVQQSPGGTHIARAQGEEEVEARALGVAAPWRCGASLHLRRQSEIPVLGQRSEEMLDDGPG